MQTGVGRYASLPMPDRTTVPRARSTVMPPLQRSGQDKATVPRTCSTVMPLLQRIKTGPQSPGNVPRFCPLFRESRQDLSPQNTFFRCALSSENQDRTTVPRACSTVMPPLQRSKTGPQSPEHVPQFCPLFSEAGKTRPHYPERVLQLCPLFREARQDHSPRVRSTVMPPLQRSKTGPLCP